MKTETLKLGLIERLMSVNNISPEQQTSYQDSLKYYRDLKNSLDTASDERAIEIALNSLDEGISIEVIAKITRLSIEQIEKLKGNKR